MLCRDLVLGAQSPVTHVLYILLFPLWDGLYIIPPHTDLSFFYLFYFIFVNVLVLAWHVDTIYWGLTSQLYSTLLTFI